MPEIKQFAFDNSCEDSEESYELPDHLKVAFDWANTVESLIPASTYQPIKLQEYATELSYFYNELYKQRNSAHFNNGNPERIQEKVATSILEETYLAAVLLDSDAEMLNQLPSSSGRPVNTLPVKLFKNKDQLTFMVKDPQRQGVYHSTVNSLEQSIEKSQPSQQK